MKVNSLGGRIDNMAFWVSTFAYPICWALFSLISLLRFHFTWLLISGCVAYLSSMNAYLFYQASRQTNQKVNLLNYIPDTMKTKAVDTLKITFVNAMGSAVSNIV